MKETANITKRSTSYKRSPSSKLSSLTSTERISTLGHGRGCRTLVPRRMRRERAVLSRARAEPDHKTTSSSTSLERVGTNRVRASSSGVAHLRNAPLLRTRVPGIPALTAATPLAIGTITGAAAAGVYGISNMIKYGKNQKSGTDAVKDTVKGSAGVGIATGLAIAAANTIAGTSLALGSVVIVPMATGFAVAYGSIKIWNKLVYKESPSKIA